MFSVLLLRRLRGIGRDGLFLVGGFVGYSLDVVVKAEDGASQEKSLRDVHEYAGGDIIDVDDLINSNSNTANDKQYRHCILRDFEVRIVHFQS